MANKTYLKDIIKGHKKLKISLYMIYWSGDSLNIFRKKGALQ